MKISVIERITTPNNCVDIDLNDVMKAIQTGSLYRYDFKQVTERIKTCANHSQQGIMKRNYLQAALFNGTFSYRNNNGLKSYSGVIAIDVDGLSVDDVERWFHTLKKNPLTYFVFRTPSGHGIKFLVLHNNSKPVNHADLYDQICDSYGIGSAVDKSVRDIARANYICYDPNAWINPTPQVYDYTPSRNISTTPVSTKNMNCKRNTVRLDVNSIRNAINQKPPIVSNKSDQSVINILNASFKKKNPNRTAEGGRANNVFQEASQYCLAGVEVGLALSKLKKIYGSTGFSLYEIQYQALRGYQSNMNEFGKTRTKFDSYGSKNKGKLDSPFK